MVNSVQFCVPGTAQPQGSKVGRIVRGNVVMIEQADLATPNKTSGRLKTWRMEVSEHAWFAWRSVHSGVAPAPWDGPVSLSAEFVLPRPISDRLKSGDLRKGARAAHTVKPDLSKLVRAIEDSMSGVVYRDDAQAVEYCCISKRYCGPSEHPHVTIIVTRLSLFARIWAYVKAVLGS